MEQAVKSAREKAAAPTPKIPPKRRRPRNGAPASPVSPVSPAVSWEAGDRPGATEPSRASDRKMTLRRGDRPAQIGLRLYDLLNGGDPSHGGDFAGLVAELMGRLRHGLVAGDIIPTPNMVAKLRAEHTAMGATLDAWEASQAVIWGGPNGRPNRRPKRCRVWGTRRGRPAAAIEQIMEQQWPAPPERGG